MFRKALLLSLLGGLSFSLTLREAVERALENNLQIKAQYHRYEAAKNDFYAQVARRFGEVDFFWQYTQYKFPRAVAPIFPPTPTAVDDQVRVYGFRYAVRVFDGCGQFFLIKAKRDTARLEERLLEKSSAEVKRDVRKLYLSALAVKAQIQTLMERRREVESLYRIVKTAYEVGKRPLLDLLNVRAELKRVDAAIANAEANYNAILNDLKVVLNTDEPLEVEDVKISPKRVDAEDLLPLLLKGNPDLKAAEVQKRIADDYRRVALSQFSPKVDFSYTKQRYIFGGSSKDDWSYAISVSLPVFDFGNRLFTYLKASHEDRRAERLRELLRRRVVQDLKTAVERLNGQLEVIKANREALEFARRAYAVEKRKYQTGKSDIYNLLKAETLYYQALSDYRTSVYRWGELKAELDYLLGR
ncbi:MAG TPA: TolC family protein [Aquifex sp.]|nr:TolC family protein [Aquifex sp.]